MRYEEKLQQQVTRLEREILQLRKLLISHGLHDRKKAERAWQKLLAASEEISQRWSGPSAVEEIRHQREK